ncbi:VTT domain-containing protein [Virgibacillus sp. 179-BFC.A HS]|uniref:TVP38/TMEM64 family membrane protein n=1 Tax=Tigheibacillus jepli TaxID=3035914 RepID=A0ABU5CGC4_9BACI|nr:VTT domain-containing protein [Virgibacillus sp. 179-BFC.A HS]MDY0405373.1 VTT domain-containing protein [Virgibacillus sp. 179-BFC.A HS]
MEQLELYIMSFIENGGILAPVLFICFHLLRPLFFLPVVFICVSGGVLFGTLAGSLYSVIGITLSSVAFYGIIQWMPKTLGKLTRLREKLMGKNRGFTIAQVAVLRLVPFIHFHLLSLCLIEMSSSFKDYTKASFFSNIPLALVYTTLGQWIANLSPLHITVFLLLLLPFIFILRRKEIIIKWQDFFQTA